MKPWFYQDRQLQNLCITCDTHVDAVEDFFKDTDLSRELQKLDTDYPSMLRLLPFLYTQCEHRFQDFPFTRYLKKIKYRCPAPPKSWSGLQPHPSFDACFCETKALS